jgi:hypothetical protein
MTCEYETDPAGTRPQGELRFAIVGTEVLACEPQPAHQHRHNEHGK